MEDDQGRLVAPVAKQQVDIFGRVVVNEDAKGNKVLTKYTALDKPYEILYPDGTKELFQYDLSGNMLLFVSKSGAKTYIDYDPFGREIKKRTLDEQGTVLSSSSQRYRGKLLVEKIDSLGLATQFEYDPFGRVKKEIRGKNSTHYRYDSLGRMTRTEQYEGDLLLATLVKKYDTSGRLTEEAVIDGKVLTEARYIYDPYGRCIFMEKGGELWTYFYDLLGRKVEEIDPLNRVTRYCYDESYQNHLGQTVLKQEKIDPKGNKEVLIHDTLERERTCKKFDPFGQLLYERETLYDLSGQPARIEEGGQVTLITYDCLNRPTGWVRALGTQEERRSYAAYNALGKRESLTKADGVRLYYTYDALGRLIALSSSDLTVSYRYEYNGASLLTRVDDLILGQVETRDYSLEGHLIKEGLQNGTFFLYSHDALGRKKTITLPDMSTLSYTYNALSVTSVIRKGAKTEWEHRALSFNTFGQVEEATLLGYAGTIHYSYDPLGRLTAIAHPKWSEKGITYDELGNITSYTLHDALGEVPCHFTYDCLGQLESEKGTHSHQYRYDRHRNRIEKDGSCCLFDRLNQLTSDGMTSYLYNHAGNLTKITTPSSTMFLTYDALDRLIKVEKDGQTTHYRYDSHNRRMSRLNGETTHFLYIDQDEVGAYVNYEITQFRALSPSLGAEIGAAVALELDGSLYIPIHDHIGNVACLLNEEGQVVETLRYSAFGETDRPPSISPWTFSSKRFDQESGLISFGRRFYLPSCGRFITPDPEWSSLHPYLFADNAPLTHLDLYGLETQAAYSSTTFEFFCSALSSIFYYTGWAISNIGHHFIAAPILRDIFTSVGDLFMGRGWRWEPHYPTTYATSTSVEGDSTSDTIRIHCNGMLNNKDDFAIHAPFLQSDGAALIHVYSPTHGFIGDILSTVLNWLGFDTSSSRELRAQIRSSIAANPEKMIEVQAHSRGGAVLDNALSKMTGDELLHVRACTYGSATLISPSRAREVVNFVAANDWIPHLCNPIRFLRAMFGENYNIIYIPSQVNPFTAHTFLGEPYAKAAAMVVRKEVSWAR